MYRLISKIEKSHVILFIRDRKTYNNSIVDDIVSSLCDKIDGKKISIDYFDELKKLKTDKKNIIVNNYKISDVISQYIRLSDNYNDSFFNSIFNKIIQNVYIDDKKLIFKDEFNNNQHYDTYKQYRYFDLVLRIENDGIRVIKSRYDTSEDELFSITQILRKSKLKRLEKL